MSDGSKILIVNFGNTDYWELTLLFVNCKKKKKKVRQNLLKRPGTWCTKNSPIKSETYSLIHAEQQTSYFRICWNLFPYDFRV